MEKETVKSDSNDMKNLMKRINQKILNVEFEGIGVIEIILILVIIIGLVLIFRNQITDIIQSAFDSINENAGGINEEIIIK